MTALSNKIRTSRNSGIAALILSRVLVIAVRATRRTTVLGAPKTDEKLKGGEFGEHWYAPSLSRRSRDGLGGWSAAEIVEYLKTGSNAKSAAAGPMAEVVKNSTQYLSDADLNADCDVSEGHSPPRRTTRRKTTEDRQAGHGLAARLSMSTTAPAAIMENGEGIAQVFPPLKASAAGAGQGRPTR